MYLVGAARCDSLAAVRRAPALWRRVRRYPLPVQLALAAAEQALAQHEDPSRAALISLAPCVGGSAELADWVARIDARAGAGSLGELRVNPTHTLHAIDNLALSDLALALGNHGYGLGLGSAPGQAWAALELLTEREDAEALLLAGDHAGPETLGAGLGVALGFRRAAAPCALLGERRARLVGVAREAAAGSPRPSASAGLDAMLVALREAPAGEWTYRVPAGDGDGFDAIGVRWELT